MDILKELKLLYVCEQGCEGRCKRCPQDVVTKAVARIEELEAALRKIAKPALGGKLQQSIARDALEGK
jgi:hypothetical protein